MVELARNSITEYGFGCALPHRILAAVRSILQREWCYKSLRLLERRGTHICAAPSGLHVLFVKRFVTAAGNVTVWRTKGPQFARAKMLYLTRQHVANGENLDKQDTRGRFWPRAVTVFGTTSVSQDHKLDSISPERNVSLASKVSVGTCILRTGGGIIMC